MGIRHDILPRKEEGEKGYERYIVHQKLWFDIKFKMLDIKLKYVRKIYDSNLL